jgi:hypothetical protein
MTAQTRVPIGGVDVSFATTTNTAAGLDGAGLDAHVMSVGFEATSIASLAESTEGAGVRVTPAVGHRYGLATVGAVDGSTVVEGPADAATRGEALEPSVPPPEARADVAADTPPVDPLPQAAAANTANAMRWPAGQRPVRTPRR